MKANLPSHMYAFQITLQLTAIYILPDSIYQASENMILC